MPHLKSFFSQNFNPRIHENYIIRESDKKHIGYGLEYRGCRRICGQKTKSSDEIIFIQQIKKKMMATNIKIMLMYKF